jgi:hypothetical protein
MSRLKRVRSLSHGFPSSSEDSVFQSFIFEKTTLSSLIELSGCQVAFAVDASTLAFVLVSELHANLLARTPHQLSAFNVLALAPNVLSSAAKVGNQSSWLTPSLHGDFSHATFGTDRTLSSSLFDQIHCLRVPLSAPRRSGTLPEQLLGKPFLSHLIILLSSCLHYNPTRLK